MQVCFKRSSVLCLKITFWEVRQTKLELPMHLIAVSSQFLRSSLIVLFFKFLEDMSPFCGATDTTVSDFWWPLLWVPKPEWVLPYLSLAEAYVYATHSLRFTSGGTLPSSWQPAWQPSHLFHIPIMPPLTVWDQADALPTELSWLG